jgi:hypothetical protein
LLDDTGLNINQMEVEGQQLGMLTNNITVSSSLMDAGAV